MASLGGGGGGELQGSYSDEPHGRWWLPERGRARRERRRQAPSGAAEQTALGWNVDFFYLKGYEKCIISGKWVIYFPTPLALCFGGARLEELQVFG